MINSTCNRSEMPMSVTELERDKVTKEQITQSLACLSTNIDLEGTAHYSGALVRKRVIRSAVDLLRFVLVYALTDLSLTMVGLWGTIKEWGSLSKSGIYKRLCGCQIWIGLLIVAVLQREKLILPRRDGISLRLFDASTVSYPGSHKIDWRLHLGFDLTAGRMTDIQLTDAKQGESLTRFQFSDHEICLADRASGVPRSLGVLLGANAGFIIRIGWSNLPMGDADGHPFSLTDWLGIQSTDPAAQPAQVMLYVNTPQGRFPVRVIARAIPPDKAAEKRKRLQTEAKHKKHRLDQRTVLAAGFVMVVSNLDTESWSANEILDLYRFRWQIELIFKSLKSLLNFDHLRATEPRLAQVYLLSKLLIALLVTEAEWRLILDAPASFFDPKRPVSHWRLTQLTLQAFQHFVCGSLTGAEIKMHLSQLARYLCDEPRCRKRQLTMLWNIGLL